MKILFLLLALLPGAARAGLDESARALAAAVAEKPAGLTALLDADFFRQLSLERASGLLADLYRDNGAVTAVKTVRAESPNMGHFIFETEKGFDIPAAVALNPENGRVSGFYFGQPYRHNPTLKLVREKLDGLPGKKAFLARRLGRNGADLEACDPGSALAVGSVFKLYVLGAMLQEGMSWKKIVTLEDGDRSLPSGRLQDWPAGAPFTAYTLAAMMVSESDNTAADMLISALGRRALEADLRKLGHSSPERLKPFLRTSELFRLKSDSEASLKYLNLPAEERYLFLAGLASRPLAAAELKQSPFGAAAIEWTASPADLCRLMEYFSRAGSSEALDIMAMNPGLNAPEGFTYAGYKGGSEPGVLAMTWLLRDKDGAWYCVAGAWNDDVKELDQPAFFGLMQTALNALAPSAGKAE